MSWISKTHQHNRFRLLLRHAARATFPLQQRGLSSDCFVNTLDYEPLLETIKRRREEARRSIIVQVKGMNSAEDLYSYCSHQFGPVSGLHYYKNTASKSFTDFFVVEFEEELHVNLVLDTATHSTEKEGAAGDQPIPVYSPFLWLSSGLRDPGGSSATELSQSVARKAAAFPVFNDTAKEEEDSSRGQYSSISDQMVRLCQADEISDTNHRVRFLVCRQLELALRGMFPRVAVFPFGSAVNSFGQKRGDQDMVLVLDPAQERKRESRLVFHAKGALYGGERLQVRRYCDEISNIVQLFLPGCQDVQKILYARVPIIKYRQELVGLDCDLSMSSSSGLYMSCLLHLWAGTDWRVRPLVAIVRRWAKSQKLVKDVRPTNYFTNFVLTLLVVCYLQQQHGMLPSVVRLQELATAADSVTCEDGLQVRFRQDIGPLKRELNCSFDSALTPLELLQGFFQFYSQVDFSAVCLCPITGQMTAKNRTWSNSSALDIVNPLESNLNVSYNVNATAVKLFTDKCAEAAKKSAQLCEQDCGGGKVLAGGILALFGQERAAQSFSMPRIQELGLLHAAPAGPIPTPPATNRTASKSSKRTPVEMGQSEHLQININSLFSENRRDGNKHAQSIKTAAAKSDGGSDDGIAFDAQQAETAKRLEKLKQQYLRSTGYKPVFKQKL